MVKRRDPDFLRIMAERADRARKATHELVVESKRLRREYQELQAQADFAKSATISRPRTHRRSSDHT
jgi:hypothetical protein